MTDPAVILANLVSRCAGGDDLAPGELYDRLGKAAFAFARTAVRDDVLAEDVIQVVSLSNAGSQVNGAGGAALSADGRFVAFESDQLNLVAGDTNGFQDVFVRDRAAGTTELVSVG